jgi:hypothetical protein
LGLGYWDGVGVTTALYSALGIAGVILLIVAIIGFTGSWK